MMKTLEVELNPKEIRRRLGMNQQEFWTRIGVTQSGGSRYESGRSMPRPVRELLRLVHIERLDLSKVKREDFDLLDHMKSHHPELYQSLRRAIRSKRRKTEDTTH
jgi:transcriptional regulator with XRE-family HTH domain